jgi:elongation factor G
MGDIIGDLNRRRGQIEGMEEKSGARVIRAMVPLSELFGYVTVLRTLSSGRATSSMEFSKYVELPKLLAVKVLDDLKGRTDLL